MNKKNMFFLVKSTSSCIAGPSGKANGYAAATFELIEFFEAFSPDLFAKSRRTQMRKMFHY